MTFEETSLLVNIILCVLSFVLAAISVITVIVTLKQNGKMIQATNDQISEMKKEHELSLQPIIEFTHPVFIIEKPRLFYSPPEDDYSIQSRFRFVVEVKNLSSAIAVNYICSSVAIVDNGHEGYTIDSSSERINLLADISKKIDFMFLEEKSDGIYDSLREGKTMRLPQCEMEAVFRNTTGGAFRMRRRFVINPQMGIMEKIKEWHSFLLSAKSEYKEELRTLSLSHGKNRELFRKLQDKIKEKGGAEIEISIDCVELDDYFDFEPISTEEYTEMVSHKSFPVFIGSTQKECISIEKSRAKSNKNQNEKSEQ